MTKQSGTIHQPTAQGNSREWFILGCPQCGGLTVIEAYPGIPEGHIIKVLPDSLESISKIKHVPPTIDRHYIAASRALLAGLPDAAAVELRKTLEGAASHVGIKEQNLAKSIEKLIAEGFITKEFGKAPQHVRLLGNQGAHFTDQTVDPAAVELALNFTAQVLRNLFEVPGELAELELKASEALEPTDEM